MSGTPDEKSPLEIEVAHKLGQGCIKVSVEEMDRRFRALGYTLDRRLDCRSTARYMDGPRSGFSYPSISTGIKEMDTGRSAFNYEARRDTKFREMQNLRQQLFAVINGAILEP